MVLTQVLTDFEAINFTISLINTALESNCDESLLLLLFKPLLAFKPLNKE